MCVLCDLYMFPCLVLKAFVCFVCDGLCDVVWFCFVCVVVCVCLFLCYELVWCI